MLIIIAGVLIPIGMKIISVLNKLLVTGEKSVETLGAMTDKLEGIIKEQYDVKVRDTHMRHEIEALKTALNQKSDKQGT